MKIHIEKLLITEKESLYGGFSNCIEADDYFFAPITNATSCDKLVRNTNCGPKKVCTNNGNKYSDIKEKDKSKNSKCRKNKTNDSLCMVNPLVCIER